MDDSRVHSVLGKCASSSSSLCPSATVTMVTITMIMSLQVLVAVMISHLAKSQQEMLPPDLLRPVKRASKYHL